MEAMTACSVAALTIYDMCKAADKGIVIEQVRLKYKAGGRAVSGATIDLLYFARVAELVGKRGEAWPLDDESTGAQLLAALGERYPQLAPASRLAGRQPDPCQAHGRDPPRRRSRGIRARDRRLSMSANVVIVQEADFDGAA